MTWRAADSVLPGAHHKRAQHAFVLTRPSSIAEITSWIVYVRSVTSNSPHWRANSKIDFRVIPGNMVPSSSGAVMSSFLPDKHFKHINRNLIRCYTLFISNLKTGETINWSPESQFQCSAFTSTSRTYFNNRWQLCRSIKIQNTTPVLPRINDRPPACKQWWIWPEYVDPARHICTPYNYGEFSTSYRCLSAFLD